VRLLKVQWLYCFLILRLSKIGAVNFFISIRGLLNLLLLNNSTLSFAFCLMYFKGAIIDQFLSDLLIKQLIAHLLNFMEVLIYFNQED